MDIAVVQQPLQRLSGLLAPELQEVDSLIRTRMMSENAPRIPDITQHLMDAGGKKLRPILTLASATLFNYRGYDHIRMAATVEFIHTATLLHDDVVDESKQRRGRPTSNLIWDNKSAVLVGDFLFARSFQLMTETNDLKVLSLLADASATIAEGEILQLTAAQDITTTESIYLTITRGKTAALFSAAAKVGGLIAQADEAALAALYTYGDALGIAFQIADDLLDYTGKDDTTGKNSGDDFREGKMTLPIIKAVSQASESELAFWQRTIGHNQQQAGDFDEARGLMEKYDALAATRAEALKWAERARDAIATLPECEIRNLLYDLAGYIVNRAQ